MGGIPKSEADKLTYWQFTALRHEWEKRHRSEKDEPMPLPDPEFVRQRQEELLALGIVGKAH